jgi:uncharacterized protein (TIGR03000 family)
MTRLRAFLLGAPALAGLILTASPAPAWDFGSDAYSPRWPVPPSYYGYNLDETNPSYYGGGRYREYYGYGRGYGVANFPLPLPAYHPHSWSSHRHDHDAPSPADLALQPAPATGQAVEVVVRVPDGAQVWFDGAATAQAGTTRRFVSPPLAADRAFTYELRARWTADGKAVEQTQNVSVRAGATVNVAFPLPQSTTAEANRNR